MIVSLDPELNNLVFQQEERLFQCWYPNSFMRVFGADSIITTFGSSHRHVRNLVLRLFGPENLRRAMLQEMQKTAQASLLSWLDRPSIEVKEEVSSMIFSIIAKKLISYDSSASNGKLWKQFDAFLQGLLAFPIYLPGTAFYECMQGRKNVMRMLRELLDERKKKTAHQLESIDFFDALIDELKQEKPAVSENVALDLLFLLLFASFETTSSGITAILRFLTDNPMALEELTEEHDRILKRKADPNSQITWEEYKSMKFTSHVIHEALRLANIAPVVFRKARQDVHIKGYTIPKGSKIMLSPSNIHLNPTVYKDPNEFNPWRWKGRKNVMKMLKELIDERKEASGRRGSIDFIDVLLEELNEEKPLISENVALDLIFLLLFASFETTASAITAVVRFLTDNPEALQELAEEHDNIQKRRVDLNSEITWEEYKSMKFTSHVIHEALRLANIAPVMFRKATEDVHIKGFFIPKGSKIMICPSTVHLNPMIYKDPNIFNPWRWKDTAEPTGGASKDFMAFGGGLRLCVGADFAKLQTAIFLHCLVTKYRWKAIKGGTMVLGPGLRFPEGFHIQLFPKP
uniref:Cytochrome P450 n=1 Tax=Oryza glumipatula TaxID=40148 RepID=A0A0D9ZBA4_9ORYZ